MKRKSRLNRSKSNESKHSKLKTNLYDPRRNLGIVLGNKCEVIKVVTGSPADWNGVKLGFIVRQVDDTVCDATTVKALLKGAKTGKKKYRIVFEPPDHHEEEKTFKSLVEVKTDAEPLDPQSPHADGDTRVGRKESAAAGLWPKTPAPQEAKAADSALSYGAAEPPQQQAGSGDPQKMAALEAENKQLKARVETLEKDKKGLQQALKEIQDKETKTRIAYRDMDMRKSSKIQMLEKQIRNLVNDKNKMRKNMKTKTKGQKSKPLGVISEDDSMSPRQLAGKKPVADMGRSSLPHEPEAEQKMQMMSPPAYGGNSAPTEVSVDVYYRGAGAQEKNSMQDMWKVAKQDVKRGRALSIGTDFGGALDAPLGEDELTFGPDGPKHERTYSDAPTEWTEVTDLPSPRAIDKRNSSNMLSPHNAFNSAELRDNEETFERQDSFGTLDVDDYNEDTKTVVSRGDSVIILSEAEIKRREASLNQEAPNTQKRESPEELEAPAAAAPAADS